MVRLLGSGVVGLAMLLLWAYCVFDVIASNDVLIRNLPKTVWLLIVIFVPTIGSVAWLALGRPEFVGWKPGDTSKRAPRPVTGVEDRPDFGRSTANDEQRLRRWEEDLRRREREMKQRSDGDDPPPDPPGSSYPFTW